MQRPSLQCITGSVVVFVIVGGVAFAMNRTKGALTHASSASSSTSNRWFIWVRLSRVFLYSVPLKCEGGYRLCVCV